MLKNGNQNGLISVVKMELAVESFGNRIQTFESRVLTKEYGYTNRKGSLWCVYIE